jgi:predicted MFS family arabinose efflux permease
VEPRQAEIPAQGISNGLVALLAVSCGLVVANLYYTQPLLKTIADALDASSATAGLIVTSSLVGYALGLTFLVPLGDVLSPRRMVSLILIGAAAALAASAAAPSIAVLIVLALPLGACSSVAQVLVPLAASLAGDAERGRVVGAVMGGLLMGILLARTLSGLVAGATSWRVVYLLATVMMLVLGAVLSKALPSRTARDRPAYGDLLRSTLSLFISQPLLRRRAMFGMCGFAAFSAFWTTIAFLLSGPHYRYSDTVIGLFGLVGAAGALCANVAGRFSDRGWSNQATLVFSLLTLGSFGPIYLGRHSLTWLIVGIIVLDVGAQGIQITNQGLIYALAPHARSRINSSYMVCYFIGGASGSAIAGALESAGGWAAVCGFGAATGAGALVLWALDRLRPARPGRTSGPAGP